MTHWTAKRTEAHRNVGNALTVVDDLLGFAKDGKGKPTQKERALFAAAIVFSYGIWENFVEQLAIELTALLAKDIEPEKVPEPIRRQMDKRTAWELTVTPGWRALWVEHVTVLAIGDDDQKFGMNTAKAGQVRQLLTLAGVDDPYSDIEDKMLPEHLPQDQRTVTGSINALVELRGSIVHTGKVPGTLRKGHVRAWRTFVEVAADKIDESCRRQCQLLVP